jgi:hypothetical protein
MTGKSDSGGEEAAGQYEQLVHDAPPEILGQIHEEAFEQLTPQQRQDFFDALVERATSDEERPENATSAELARATSVRGNDPFGVDTGLFNVFVAYAIGSELALLYLGGSTLPDGPVDFGGGFDGPDGIDAF